MASHVTHLTRTNHCKTHQKSNKPTHGRLFAITFNVFQRIYNFEPTTPTNTEWKLETELPTVKFTAIVLQFVCYVIV